VSAECGDVHANAEIGFVKMKKRCLQRGTAGADNG
jgi:hypothetical protein